MTTTTVERSGKMRDVRNLGWLMRHRHQVEQVIIHATEHNGHHYVGKTKVTAFTSDGYIYRTEFASREICLEWFAKRFSNVTTINPCI